MREYVVLDRSDLDPRRHELSVAGATAIGLFGRRMGESADLSGDGKHGEWTVVSLLAASVMRATSAPTNTL
jgi:transcription elongation GreA/GreB family factor